MTIRLATLNDIPAIQRLLRQILTVHHAVRPDIFQAAGSKCTDAELTELIEHENTPVFVYMNESGDVIGHVFLQLKTAQRAVLQPIKTLFIEDLCVDEAARGQKIGEQLYDFAVDFAKQNGCYNLALNVWNDNAGAVRFYEKRGMKAQSTTMETIL